MDPLPRPAGRDWTTLADSLEAGLCAVMLGPDAVKCRAAGGNEFVPVLDALGDYLRDRLRKEGVPIDKALVRTSMIAETVVASRGRAKLETWVEEFYDSCQLDQSALEDLARLPVDLIVNTIPGLRLEDAYGGAKAGRHVEYYSRAGAVTRLVPEGTVGVPLIYHLYGSLDERRSLVVSDTDLLDILVSVIKESPPLPANLISTIRDPKRTFLFLGFQLYEWQLRVLIHVLDEACERTTRSPAFERLPNPDLDTGTITFYAGPTHQIDFFGVDVSEFLAQLVLRIEAGDNSEEVQGPVEPGGPPVFICHTSADKLHAENLANQLQAHGITTWVDRENLRGGVRWDDQIEHVLENDARFVVVLQSRNLLDQVIGLSYVNKEINIALDMQQRVGFGGTFLIPTFIEDAEPLRREIDERENQLQLLRALQSIDLTQGGVNDLVAVIQREIERDQKTRRTPWS